ncbi:cyclophilin-like domain-containing protein [Pholiota molesta]|nr:cyclophilin-like domain-containing protein [Pholiota molesta]
MSTSTRPVVFMDINIGETPAGRLKMELFSDIVPKTAENFRQLCTGEYRWGATFHRVPNFMCQGKSFNRTLADLCLFLCRWRLLERDGTGSFSIYGDKFPVATINPRGYMGRSFLNCSPQDENFQEKHTGPGLLSMANSGPNTNGCQFFITTAKCDFLDGKHVVFGKVIDGMLTLRKIENVPTGPNNRPKLVVKITECGEM